MTRTFLITAIALLGTAIFASHANAACGSSVRVSAADSECLEETHNNSSYTAKNHCLHEIKIKIDIKNGSDSTNTISAGRLAGCAGTHCAVVTVFSAANGILPTVETGSIRTSWGRRIQAVKCCSDYTSCDRRTSERYPN